MADIILMAQARMKLQFDKKHKPIDFEVGQKIYLKLIQGTRKWYRLPKSNVFSPVKEGPLETVEKVGKLAYRLQLPPRLLGMHNVVSVIHLEPAPSTADEYSRPVPKPQLIEFGGETYYEVEKILGIERRKRKKYFHVQWKGYKETS
jgi:hypothetical protein